MKLTREEIEEELRGVEIVERILAILEDIGVGEENLERHSKIVSDCMLKKAKFTALKGELNEND